MFKTNVILADSTVNCQPWTGGLDS